LDIDATQSLLIEEAKSDELIAALRCVAETTVNGNAKFSPKVHRDLARVIACRSYASAVLETCHLVVFASTCDAGGRYEPLFWDSGPARSGAFKAFVESAGPLAPSIRADPAGVAIDYGDGTFTVTFGRMAFLSAMVDFLMTALGYADMDDLLAPLSGGNVPDRAVVTKTANAVSRRIYDYLKTCLPTAQAQRKTRRIVDFLKRRSQSRIGPEDVDDAAVLDFWLEASTGGSEGADFKAYRTVFVTAARLGDALGHALERQRMDNPRSIGSDREAGEVDPGEVLEAVTQLDEKPDVLGLLDELPAASVKFLNGRETDVLEGLLIGCRPARTLVLSVLRNAVFGKAQARLTNHLRSKPDMKTLRRFIEEATITDYAKQVDTFETLRGHLDRVLLAALFALVRARRASAIDLLLGLYPKLDLKHLAQEFVEPGELGDNVVPLRGQTPSERFLDMLNVTERLDGELARIMGEARAAFRALSRKGFTEQDLEDEAIRDGFVAGAPALLTAHRDVTAFLDVRIEGFDYLSAFTDDSETFRRQFHILYGESDG
jgi:hypothetical protein